MYFSFLLLNLVTLLTAVQAAPVPAFSGYRNVGYFTNWGIYGRNYLPSNIPVSQLTHLHYAFANIHPNGTVFLTDLWADVQKPYPGDTAGGNNLLGNLKQLYLLKKKNRSLKVILSIGGWTYGPNFVKPASTSTGRLAIAKTAVKLVAELGFDGLDIDWEFPKTKTEATNYITLLKDLREELDKYVAATKSNHMTLSVALPAGPAAYQILDPKGMNPYVDYMNVMAYDYTGSFSPKTGHQANLYADKVHPEATPFNTDQAITFYLSKGVPARKLGLGMATYGPSFTKTVGPALARPYNGVGPGEFEEGLWDIKVLPQSGAKEYTSKDLGASWSWDAARKTIMSYDNKAIAQLKAQYLIGKKLGGAMFWELSGDRAGAAGNIPTVLAAMKASGAVDVTLNTLKYPNSVYPNVKAGMP